jgi:hypothetical protein
MMMYKKLMVGSCFIAGALCAENDNRKSNLYDSFNTEDWARAAAIQNELNHEIKVNAIAQQIQAAMEGALTESTQRTIDGLRKVVESEKYKQSCEKHNETIGNALRESSTEMIQDFMNEIQPEDAQKLLPLFDAVESLIVHAIESFKAMETMAPIEKDLAVKRLHIDFLTLVLRGAAYMPAIKNNEEFVKGQSEKNLNEVLKAGEKLVEVFHSLRAIVEKKAQS